MWEKYQKTIKDTLNFSGIGLHSGVKVDVILRPADSNVGIVFKRTDLNNNNEILANFKNVSSVKLCTKIENKSGVSVSTIEHLMAAFYICGIDNLIVDINGPEVPIMDGSSVDFVRMIESVGFKILDKKREFIVIKKRVELKEEKRSIIIEPADSTFKVKFTLSYKNSLIGNQENFINFKNEDLDLREIYSARTFCLFEDVEKIKSLGLAKGGSLDNALVVQGDRVINKEGTRFEKEFVNHKILDLLGDFMLAGKRFIGSVDCLHGGHSLTNVFLRKIFSDHKNFSFIEDKTSLSFKKAPNYQKKLAVNA